MLSAQSLLSSTSAHSLLSPSCAHRWLRCPGSVALCAEVQERDASEFSAEGTVAHHVREMCLLFGMEPEAFLGQRIGADGFTFAIGDEMVEALTPGIEWVRERQGRVVHEHRVKFDRWLPGQFGTLDVGIVGKDLIIVNDLKYGAGLPVSAFENEQLMIYALGFWEEIARHETEATDFLLVVDQPRARRCTRPDEFEDDSEVLEATKWGGEWHVTLDELLEFGERVKTGYDIATSPGAWLRAGDKQCQFCPRKGSCDEFARRAAALLQVEFADLDPDTIVLPNHGEFTAQHRANVAKDRDHITKWVNAVHAQVLNDAKLGRETPGMKAVTGPRGNRKWADEEAAEEFMESHLLLDEARQKPKVLSPAMFEKIKGISAEAKVEMLDLVTRSAGKAILVEEADKRPAIDLADEWDAPDDDDDVSEDWDDADDLLS